MLECFDYSEYANRVFHVSKDLVCQGRSKKEISGGMHLLLLAMERDLVRFGDAPDCSMVACGPGCGSCCVLNVEVLLPEAITISWYLQRSLTQTELSELNVRLEDLHVKTRWLDDEERLFVR